ncbi:MAG: N-acetyltransferase [Clostridiales bacterium]|nr:N-acetyltransferase [Clostridiales bacterium]
MIYRKALLDDAEQIYELANYYAEKGDMLTRARYQIYENIRDFVVAEDQGTVIGMGALHVMWSDLAEVRTLAVAESHKRQGIGSRIVRELLEDGKALGVKKFFALTYQPVFFGTCGFREEDKNNMPQKVWMECINCPKFPNCDEICMTYVPE